MTESSSYFQLFLLGEPFDLPRRGLAHEGHDPDDVLVAVQHGGNLLHALAERREDHHTRAHFLLPAGRAQV